MPWLLYICIFFSDFMCFDMSLLLLTVTLRGVSNKHCLLPLFSLYMLLAHLSQRLIGELIGYSWSTSSSTMLKDLLRNRFANQSQIIYGASLGRGNDILFAASGSHDQDGRHAHIW